MTPQERARFLRRRLQEQFRIDLFSPVAELDFERQLMDAIQAAERDAYRRGRESSVPRSGPQRPAAPPPTRQ